MSTNKIQHLDLHDDFHRTIYKLRAMADFLPRALDDGQALLRGTENGIGYILEDIIKEMEQFSDTLWNMRRNMPDDHSKKPQHFRSDMDATLRVKPGVAA
ncbi:hypothetical protein JI58_06930 [Marinosulfonomonas sp. PRT-SC04]|nr:hypothetical protein JI58_06930 [Marinosulfonomonas sp. PRT-SC04]